VQNRWLSNPRVFPALDISQSGTRKEERLIDAEMLRRVTLLQRTLVQMKPVEAMEMLVKQLAKSKPNEEFLDRIALNVK
jgi:transcription termination factor Rho